MTQARELVSFKRVCGNREGGGRTLCPGRMSALRRMWRSLRNCAASSASGPLGSSDSALGAGKSASASSWIVLGASSDPARVLGVDAPVREGVGDELDEGACRSPSSSGKIAQE